MKRIQSRRNFICNEKFINNKNKKFFSLGKVECFYSSKKIQQINILSKFFFYFDSRYIFTTLFNLKKYSQWLHYTRVVRRAKLRKKQQQQRHSTSTALLIDKSTNKQWLTCLSFIIWRKSWQCSWISGFIFMFWPGISFFLHASQHKIVEIVCFDGRRGQTRLWRLLAMRYVVQVS